MGSSLNQSTEDASPVRWQDQSVLVLELQYIVASRAVIGLCVLICLVLSLRQSSGPAGIQVQAWLIQNSEPCQQPAVDRRTTGLSAVLGGNADSMPEIDEFQDPADVRRKLAAILDKKYDLLHDIFKDNWDAKNNRWYPPDWKDRLHFQFVAALGGTPHQDPNYYDLAKFLGTNIQFSIPSLVP